MFNMNIFSRATGVLAVVCALVEEAPLRGADTGAARIEPPTVSSGKSRHWAYIKPVRPEPPTVKNKKWPRNPIDSFILARLEREKLTPAREADRATLIRRLSLDLTGLPPTVAEVDAFEIDRSPQAYDNLVDRLLASPHYGERMARLWLDLARYADSNGYHIDTRRSMWPYRDWVIQAFNQNLPFDEFTIEQLAGDLLPNATQAQRIATGFHRNTMFNEEGGIDPEEFRVGAVVDRVNTTAAVWLGTTLGCAQCHNHRGASWTSSSRPPHHSPQYNMLLGTVGVLPEGVSGGPATHAGTKFLADDSGRLLLVTNQCVTCHMQTGEYQHGPPEVAAITGHKFEVTSYGACADCHGSGANAEGLVGLLHGFVADEIQQVKARLDSWAATQAPGSLYAAYGTRAWEYTTPGDLSPGGSGPTTAEQALIPDNIKKARFDLYLVLYDGSYGVHNGPYAFTLLESARNWVEQELNK